MPIVCVGWHSKYRINSMCTSLLWPIVDGDAQIFIAKNGQNWTKHLLVIWSHCLSLTLRCCTRRSRCDRSSRFRRPQQYCQRRGRASEGHPDEPPILGQAQARYLDLLDWRKTTFSYTKRRFQENVGRVYLFIRLIVILYVLVNFGLHWFQTFCSF